MGSCCNTSHRKDQKIVLVEAPNAVAVRYEGFSSVRASTTEVKMNDSTLHGSVFNAAYLAAVVLAMVGWLWLIFYFVEWAIGI